MKDYVIINGVSSKTKTGLAINILPPITMPKMRTSVEEIDGRDGDIITKLGYSAYDKTIEIGLFGNGYNVDDIISFFNAEGTISFSNEPTKYYYFTMVNGFNVERLLEFKKASITFHCQPFKYMVDEPVLSCGFSSELITDIALNTNVSNSEFFLDAENYTAQELTNGISGFNTLTALTNQNQTIGYLVCAAVGAYLSGIAQQWGVNIYKPDGTAFGEIEPADIYLFWVEIVEGGSYSGLFIGYNLSTKTNYGSLNIAQQDILLTNVETEHYSESAIWECMKIGTENSSITVNNIGNIYSKPILYIKGSGIINIYINETQMLSANITDEITLDIPNLEAYNPTTKALMNRNVTGNLSNFILPVGQSTVSLDGNFEIMTIKNYTRWL